METAEEVSFGLEGRLREVEDDNAAADRLCNRLANAMTEGAFEEFPVLENMSAEQFRKFGDAVSRLSTEFATRTANLAFAAEQEK
jgi:hypothetical protein